MRLLLNSFDKSIDDLMTQIKDVCKELDDRSILEDTDGQNHFIFLNIFIIYHQCEIAWGFRYESIDDLMT